MSQDFEAKRIADRYRLIELVGSGGFGETWRANDELLDIDVAIKLFHNADSKQRERYLREARSLARWSRQDGIASVRDLLVEGDQVCLVMDYVAGVDLSVIIGRNKGLDLQTTLMVLRPVAEALSTMHEAGLVHRDVSPENIRVQGSGRGVLLDFGSVLSASDVARTTVMVKPGYAPPEQYGDVSTQGPWTDVYALAATAYHCLVGEAPIDSLQRTFADELKRPSELGVALAQDAEDALMRGLALDYHERTQTVAELMRGLNGETAPQNAAPQAPAQASVSETEAPREEPQTDAETNEDAQPEKRAAKPRRDARVGRRGEIDDVALGERVAAKRERRLVPVAQVAVLLVLAVEGDDVRALPGAVELGNALE